MAPLRTGAPYTATHQLTYDQRTQYTHRAIEGIIRQQGRRHIAIPARTKKPGLIKIWRAQDRLIAGGLNTSLPDDGASDVEAETEDESEEEDEEELEVKIPTVNKMKDDMNAWGWSYKGSRGKPEFARHWKAAYRAQMGKAEAEEVVEEIPEINEENGEENEADEHGSEEEGEDEEDGWETDEGEDNDEEQEDDYDNDVEDSPSLRSLKRKCDSECRMDYQHDDDHIEKSSMSPPPPKRLCIATSPRQVPDNEIDQETQQTEQKGETQAQKRKRESDSDGEVETTPPALKRKRSLVFEGNTESNHLDEGNKKSTAPQQKGKRKAESEISQDEERDKQTDSIAMPPPKRLRNSVSKYDYDRSLTPAQKRKHDAHLDTESNGSINDTVPPPPKCQRWSTSEDDAQNNNLNEGRNNTTVPSQKHKHDEVGQEGEDASKKRLKQSTLGDAVPV